MVDFVDPHSRGGDFWVEGEELMYFLRNLLLCSKRCPRIGVTARDVTPGEVVLVRGQPM